MDLLDILVKLFDKLRSFGELIFIFGITFLIRVVSKDLSIWLYGLAILMVLSGLEMIINRNREESEDDLKDYMDRSLNDLKDSLEG